MNIPSNHKSFSTAGLALLCTLFASQAGASRVRPVNLEQMTERADRIFHGRCVEVRHAVDPELGRPVVLATFEVDHAIKGALDHTVTVKLLGAGAGHAGPPQFRQDEEVVLFLYGDSSLGLTSPVGLGQGKFAVYEDKQGNRRAVNAFGNRQLMRGISSDARIRLGERAERDVDAGVDLGRLIEWTETLNRRQRSEGGAR